MAKVYQHCVNKGVKETSFYLLQHGNVNCRVIPGNINYSIISHSIILGNVNNNIVL